MSVLWEEFGFKSLFDLQIQQMTLCSTLLIMNEAYKLLVLVPNSAPHKCLKNKQKLALILFFMFFSSAVGTCYAEV